MIHDEREMPRNRHKEYLRYSNFHQKTRTKRLTLIHYNWWCRDQNFRKYFEMRKKNGIRPSETGFKHEPIRDNLVKTMTELEEMKIKLRYM